MTCFLLADMGIIILDIYVFANKHVKVNTPTSLKGSSQLDEETVVRDRRNASKRIQDHWMCQNLQTYEDNYFQNFFVLLSTIKIVSLS